MPVLSAAGPVRPVSPPLPGSPPLEPPGPHRASQGLAEPCRACPGPTGPPGPRTGSRAPLGLAGPPYGAAPLPSLLSARAGLIVLPVIDGVGAATIIRLVLRITSMASFY